ncbi:hypothetical protein LQZ18_01725 [Lachnospiraceae bacterium ZAX-1]
MAFHYQQAPILNSQIIEGLRAVETIKGNANEEVELENTEKEYIRSLRIGMKEGMLSNVQGSISSFVSTVGNLVLTYFAVMQVINGDIALGSMMTFMTLSGYFMDPVGRLVSLQLQIQEANISMKRITEILGYETEQSGSGQGNFGAGQDYDGSGNNQLEQAIHQLGQSAYETKSNYFQKVFTVTSE